MWRRGRGVVGGVGGVCPGVGGAGGGGGGLVVVIAVTVRQVDHAGGTGHAGRGVGGLCGCVRVRGEMWTNIVLTISVRRRRQEKISSDRADALIYR